MATTLKTKRQKCNLRYVTTMTKKAMLESCSKFLRSTSFPHVFQRSVFVYEEAASILPESFRHGKGHGSVLDQWQESVCGNGPGCFGRKLEEECTSSRSWQRATFEFIWKRPGWSCDAGGSQVASGRLSDTVDLQIPDMWWQRPVLFRSNTGRWVCGHLWRHIF